MLHYQQILKYCLAEIIHIKARFGFLLMIVLIQKICAVYPLMISGQKKNLATTNLGFR